MRGRSPGGGGSPLLGIYNKIICIVTPWSDTMIEFLSKTQNFIFFIKITETQKNAEKRKNQNQESNLSIRQRWRLCEHHINKKICVCWKIRVKKGLLKIKSFFKKREIEIRNSFFSFQTDFAFDKEYSVKIGWMLK